jgi:hypothetical protein
MSQATVLPPLPDTPFWRAYQGPMAGMVNWARLDAFWPVLQASGGAWYVTDLESGALPDAPATSDEFAATLALAQAMYDPVRDRSWCGVVFADDPAAPSFVKLFDPWNMGASCGSSGVRVMPRWVLSRIAPDALPEVAAEPAPAQGLFARFRRG